MSDYSHNKLILFEELNIYRDTVYLNNYLQYYTDKWVIGLQSNNIKLNGIQAQNYENDTYVNSSYKFAFEKINVDIGGQIGTNFDGRVKKLHNFDYLDFGYSLNDEFSIHGGGYYVNDVLATIHQPFNYLTGVKYKKNKLIITMDYYSGHNNMSGAVVNTYYQMFENVRPYIGIQVPEKNSGNEFAGIIGFSIKLR